MKSNLLIIIPAYNEQENIQRVVETLTVHFSQYDYIVINDGSKDDTAKICKKNRFQYIDMPVNMGLANAVRCGMRYAYQMGYSYTLQFDGDGQHQPQYISAMLQTMKETNADIIIGSRFKQKKKPFSPRMLGSRLISGCIYFTSHGHRIEDATSGMRLFNQRMIKQFAFENHYTPEPDTLAYLLRHGVHVEEVQVEMLERTAGKSYLSFSRSISYMTHIIFSILIFQWFRKKIKE